MPEEIDFAGRLAAFRAALVQAGNLDGLWVTNPTNMFYLSGFTGGTAGLLVTQDAAVIVTDSRYTEQARLEAPGYRVEQHGTPVWATLKSLVDEFRVGRLGFEKQHITYQAFEEMSAALAPAELVPTQGIIEELRAIKDPQEIARIERAVALADEGFTHILNFIKPGVSERDLNVELEFYLRRRGATAMSFPSIVASGPRGALPHGEPTDRQVQSGEFITLDFGVLVDRYCSDMTRTVAVGKINEEQKKVYETVLKAQLAGIAAVAAGKVGRDVDAVARDVIAKAGYGQYFGHGLGHGVGLNVHDAGPRLSPTEEKTLPVGAVVTVEPGIYIPGWGGVRIEDVVVVEATKARVLTHSPKELIQL